MTDTIPERVDRGVALLDEKLPGWYLRIDLDRLDLESTCNCILGQEFTPQVFGEPYLYALDHLDLDGWQASVHGFDVLDENEALGRDEYPALTAEWKRIVLARREEASC